MEKPRNQILVTGMIIVAVLAALLLYFRPMKMSELINDKQEILVTRTQIGIQNGEASINYENYNDCNQRAQTDGFAEQNGRDAERADLTCRY